MSPNSIYVHKISTDGGMEMVTFHALVYLQGAENDRYNIKVMDKQIGM